MAALWIQRCDAEDAGVVALHLEGELAGDGLSSLQEVCRLLVQGQGTLLLDLAGLTYVSPAGLCLLASLEASGVGLRNLSLVVWELLRDTGQHPKRY